MITYKYKLYRTNKTKHLDRMLLEACFVWNHALSLQKRYYRIYKKYIPLGVMQKHQAKRIKRNLLGAQTVQEILERLDIAYKYRTKVVIYFPDGTSKEYESATKAGKEIKVCRNKLNKDGYDEKSGLRWTVS